MTVPRSRRVSFAAVLAFLIPLAASAQSKPPAPEAKPAAAQSKPAVPRDPLAPAFEISVGAGFLTGSDLGDADADLRNSTGGELRLFATSSRIGTSLPVEVRFGFPFGGRYVFEARAAWARPDLETSVTGDVEGAPPVSLAETTDQYSIDAGVLVYFGRQRQREVTPFVSAAVGYVATVHEGLTLLENGMSFRGGGGVRFPLASGRRGRISAYGIRADAALVVMTNGVTSGSGATTQVATSGSLYLTF